MHTFELVQSLQVFVAKESPEPLILAVRDLTEDIQVATGQAVKAKLADNPPVFNGIIVRIVPGEFSKEAFENFRLHSDANNLLCIDGSDMRGAIYGIYTFCEQWLHIPPDYLWNQLPIRPLASFQWSEIHYASGNPDIRYRGVFINDEDLLTGWEIGGPRHTTYKYYHTVISRNTARKLAETIIRMGYNLAIPASFVDIRNPEEEMLLEEFSRRGLIQTMHHVEPLGVSAFGFDNYWKSRGQERKFSYFSDADALREVWRDSIRRWSKYPEVIWQLGLRGRGDKPFWEEGLAPESDAERAALICHAIQEQKEMVKKMTHATNPLFSTTLWGEGSLFNSHGLMSIPNDIITVFSDNCAGWRLQDDFYQSPNTPNASYGIYCHHAIMLGTHLAQAIGVADFYKVLTNAMTTRKLRYAIFNAANIREFIYGLAATAKITRHSTGFSPEQYLHQWVASHFSTMHDEISACYKAYFAAFEKNSRGVALFNDGLLLNRTVQALRRIRDHQSDDQTPSKSLFLASLTDMFPEVSPPGELLHILTRQEQNMAYIHKKALSIQKELPRDEHPFFYAQLVYPSGLNHCFCQSARHSQLAHQAFKKHQIADMKHHLAAAYAALKDYEKLLPAYITGEFEHWYDGNLKVGYKPVLELMENLLLLQG